MDAIGVKVDDCTTSGVFITDVAPFTTVGAGGGAILVVTEERGPKLEIAWGGGSVFTAGMGIDEIIDGFVATTGGSTDVRTGEFG